MNSFTGFILPKKDGGKAKYQPQSAGNIIVITDDAEVTVPSDGLGYSIKKEMKILIPGMYRVAFSLKNTSNLMSHGYIYKNGAPIGYSERSTDSTTYVEFKEDLYFNINDLVQVYCYSSGGSGYIYNFRLSVLNSVYGTVNI